jgi:hypothetical protein
MRPGEDRGAWKECLALLPPGPDAVHTLPPPRRSDGSGCHLAVETPPQPPCWLTRARLESQTWPVTVLLVLGVAVVVFGALILLLFPDRPGGKIAWQGAEVSSIGAGLPLIVVGIVAVALSGAGVVGSDDDGGGATSGNAGTPAAIKCPDDLAKSLPAQRVATVESGANAQIIAGPSASKTQPFGLRLTDGGETVGAVSATFFPASGVFKGTIVDADCHATKVQSLVPGEGGLEAVSNNADVRLDLMGQSYVLNFGGGIRLNFTRFVP